MPDEMEFGKIFFMSSIKQMDNLDLPLSVDRLSKILRNHGVIKAFVFGSFARGEQTPNSDLDLFIQCRSGASLFDVFDLQVDLEQQSGLTVDLVTKINPHFLEYIEPELIEINL